MGITGKVSAVGFFVVAIAAGQTATWEQLIDSGTEFQAKGRYADAERFFRAALEKAEVSADPERATRTRSFLGHLLEIRGDYSQAEQFLLKAVAVLDALPESLSLAVTLHNLATVYSERGQFDRAEPLCRRSTRKAQIWRSGVALSTRTLNRRENTGAGASGGIQDAERSGVHAPYAGPLSRCRGLVRPGFELRRSGIGAGTLRCGEHASRLCRTVAKNAQEGGSTQG